MGVKNIAPVAVLSLVGLSVGVATQYGAVFVTKDTSLRSLMEACSLPSRQKLASDVTHGAVPQLDNILCVAMPFFKRSVENRLNVGLFAIMVAFTIPYTYRLSFQAVSPNRKTNLFGGLPILLAMSLGMAFGIGPWSCLLGAIFYIPGTYVAMKRTNAAVPPVPTPANNIYTCNIVHVVTGFMLATVLLADHDRALWSHVTLAVQFAAVAYLPVAYKSLTTIKVNDDVKSRQIIRRYDAEGVSYSFERTWSYYRKIGGFSAIIYWYGINRVIRGIVFEKAPFDAVSTFLVFDIAGLWAGLTLMVISEKLTFRSKAATNPCTGTPRSPLDIECDKAIAKAPAGSPWFEKSTTGFVLASLIGGPGFAASLWWCSGEEELGWKARKSWREAVAVDGKKEK